MQVQERRVKQAELEALRNWFQIAQPKCFKCKKDLHWEHRRFWVEQEEGETYFFCECGFENRLAYLRFKWETQLELQSRNIEKS